MLVADSHSSMAPALGLVVLGAEGPSITGRLPLLLGATGASNPFALGDRWCKVEAGDTLWVGDAAAAVTNDVPVGLGGLVAFSVEVVGWRERAIRPRFRRSRVNWQWTSLRRQREHGKARSHRTRREWHESQAILLRLNRRLAGRLEGSGVISVVAGGWSKSSCWGESIEGHREGGKHRTSCQTRS